MRAVAIVDRDRSEIIGDMRDETLGERSLHA